MLEENRNCWKITESQEGTFLIDAASYFEDLNLELHRAKNQIFIIGWDFDSRIRLLPDSQENPMLLGELLNKLVSDQPDLHIYILVWDYIALYAFDREPFPRLTFGWVSHERIHFVLDAEHPLYASHHQKIIVIDDRVAYCGGIDLGNCRWDTPEHLVDNPLRTNPKGHRYPPFHDVQVKVSGDAAYWLGDLSRTRWQRATGDLPRPPPPSEEMREKMRGEGSKHSRTPTKHQDKARSHDGGEQGAVDVPGSLAFTRARVGISRTEPSFCGRREVREIEQVYKDLLAGARKWIFIENQYLASKTVAKVIAKRLAEPNGPQVVIILPSTQEGWFENKTMGAARNGIVNRLRKADRYRRLGIYNPYIAGCEEGLKVHSKLLVIDDEFAVVGSANLNNRSMGFDTECNLVFDASRDPQQRTHIMSLLSHLIAEHTGQDVTEVALQLQQRGDLLSLTNNCQNTQRHLKHYITTTNDWVKRFLSTAEVLDPNAVLAVERELEHILASYRRVSWRSLAVVLFVLGTVFASSILMLAIWSAMPHSTYVGFEWLKEVTGKLPFDTLQPRFVLLAYVAASLFLVPVNLLILAAASVLNIYQAIIFSSFGCLFYAFVGYLIGRFLGGKTVNSALFGRARAVAQKLGGIGLLPILSARLLVWVPFSMINIVAGAAGVNLVTFLLGTVLGLLPGIIMLSLIQFNLMQFINDPNFYNAAWFFLIAGVIYFWVTVCRRRLRLMT